MKLSKILNLNKFNKVYIYIKGHIRLESLKFIYEILDIKNKLNMDI